MRMVLIVFLLIAAPRAWAQSPEEAYVAARVQTGAVLEEKSKTGGSAWDAAYDQAKSDLAAQLRRVMGPVPAPARSAPTRCVAGWARACSTASSSRAAAAASW